MVIYLVPFNASLVFLIQQFGARICFILSRITGCRVWEHFSFRDVDRFKLEYHFVGSTTPCVEFPTQGRVMSDL